MNNPNLISITTFFTARNYFTLILPKHLKPINFFNHFQKGYHILSNYGAIVTKPLRHFASSKKKREKRNYVKLYELIMDEKQDERMHIYKLKISWNLHMSSVLWFVTSGMKFVMKIGKEE